MHISAFTTFATLALLPATAFAGFGSSFASLAHNAPRRHPRELKPRGSSGKFTWFDAGLGACGHTNQASDFIVALSAKNWDGGSHCGEQVTITANGKTATATIVDECMGCEVGHYDMSKGLFQHFTGLGTGEFSGTYSLGSSGGDSKPRDEDNGDDNGDDNDDDDKPKPSTKPSPQPEEKHTTSTKEEEHTSTHTSTKKEETTTTTSHKPTSTVQEKAANVTSSSATPSASKVVQDAVEALAGLNEAFIAMSNLVVA